MSSLKGLLFRDMTKEVFSGEIVKCQAEGMYQVKIGNRIVSMNSLVPELLAKNMQVMVAKTDEGFFIINKESIKGRKIIEVIIDG